MDFLTSNNVLLLQIYTYGILHTYSCRIYYSQIRCSPETNKTILTFLSECFKKLKSFEVYLNIKIFVIHRICSHLV